MHEAADNVEVEREHPLEGRQPHHGLCCTTYREKRVRSVYNMNHHELQLDYLA